MSSTPPFFAQERPDSCAVACCRMVLAHQGTVVSEDELVEAVDFQPGGIDPEELVRLMGQYGLRAREVQLDLTALTGEVTKDGFPIVYLHRRPIDQEERVHAVLLVRMSPHYATLLDPLRGERRVSVRKFEEGRQLIGRWVVVWEPA